MITGLDTGGAEIALFNLLSRMDWSMFDAEVITLTNKGTIGPQIESLSVPVRELGMKQGSPNPWRVIRLAKWFRETRPDVIQSWMYHADLVGGLAAKLAGGIPIVWGIRASRLDPRSSKHLTLWTAKAAAWLSPWLPVGIVCNSESARRWHIDLGHNPTKILFISNGFDTGRFAPDPAARVSVRRELGLPDDTILVGMAARFDPYKDHGNFINAVALLRTRLAGAHFLLCGSNVTTANRRLRELIRGADIGDRCHLLGQRDDIPRLLAALDIATSSSIAEGFSRVVGEAMACGVPCVVTDVGDSARIVGDTGRVVPPRDPYALAMGWIELLEKSGEERRVMGAAARARIISLFSLRRVIACYEDLYQWLAHRSLEDGDFQDWIARDQESDAGYSRCHPSVGE